MTIARSLLVLLLLFAGLTSRPPPSAHAAASRGGQSGAAVVIESQAPCVADSDGMCLSFEDDTPLLPVLQSFTFVAPTTGRGLVTVHGSLVCSSGDDFPAVIDLASQIVTDVNATADANGPGGLRHSIVLLPSATATIDTFNLASTRLLAITAPGPVTVYLKVAKVRMDNNTFCFTQGIAFSIVFVASSTE